MIPDSPIFVGDPETGTPTKDSMDKRWKILHARVAFPGAAFDIRGKKIERYLPRITRINTDNKSKKCFAHNKEIYTPACRQAGMPRLVGVPIRGFYQM